MTPDGFWQGRSVLVTGATGVLGGWLVAELVQRGAEVVALVRDGAPRSMFYREGWAGRVPTVRGSLQERALIQRALSEYEVDTVFHLAAQTLVGVAKADPIGTLEANVQGTWNVLDAARRSAVKQIVVASSDKAYGASEQLPYRETHPLQGCYPYDVSKSCADLICTMFAQTYGLPVGITRCGNLFGGGDLNFSRTIPGVIKAALHGEHFIIRSDGQYVRDFLYVKDAVLGYLMLAEHLASDGSLAGTAFNFSLEVRLTVLELVRKVLSLMGRTDLELIIQDVASGEIREQYMIAERARSILRWEPRYGLDEGLEETIDWYADFFAKPGRMARVPSSRTAHAGSMS